MRSWGWGLKTYYHVDDLKLYATVHLALCKKVLGAKGGYIYESEPKEGGEQKHFSVLGVEIENRFSTLNQTIHQMQGEMIEKLAKLTPAQIKEEYPTYYNSMIYHFHSIKEAFQNCCWPKPTDYPHHEDLSPYWAKEVVPFLGEMTDQEIADVCGCNPQRIADIRLIAHMQSRSTIKSPEKSSEEDAEISPEKEGLWDKMSRWF